MIEFRLPSLGSDMDQGRLLEWRVRPGDAVRRGQVVAVVDTSKAAIDVEIWNDGTVLALLAQPDQTLPVGTPILTLLEPGEPSAAAAVAATAARTPTPAPAPTAQAGAAIIRTPATAASAQAPASPMPATTVPAPAAAPTTPTPAVTEAPLPSQAPTAAAPEPPPARRRISPAARKHAEELGIDLAALSGTGPGGAVTLEDVERARGAAAARTAPAAPPGAPAAAPAAADTGAKAGATQMAERVARMRETIAAAMTRSKREIPHYYLATDVPLDHATRWLAQANEARPVTQRLLLAALVIKAVALAAKRFPEMNGFHRDGAFQPSAQVHVGVAISLRQGGLIAPALLDTDTRTLDDVMTGLADLVKRARAFTLRASELSAPTLTLTNLGDQGVDLVQAVIYPPQVAIVGFGRPTRRAWVEDDALKLIPVATASLAADHRVSDGHRGALFLAAVRDLLQTPEKL